MEVDILGSGISHLSYNWERKITKWSTGSCYSSFLDNINLYFCMHPEETIEHKNIIDLNSYPINEIIKKYNSRFFTNSISYMLAYALYKDYKVVNLYGVDMEAGTEYLNQRPSVAFWMGYLQSKGVEVNHITNMDKPPFLYGYNQKEINSLLTVLEIRKKGYEKQIALSTDNEAQKNQFVGAAFATDKIIQYLKG